MVFIDRPLPRSQQMRPTKLLGQMEASPQLKLDLMELSGMVERVKVGHGCPMSDEYPVLAHLAHVHVHGFLEEGSAVCLSGCNNLSRVR